MEKKSQISKKNGDSGAKNDVFSLMLLVCFRSTHETGLAAEPNLATRDKFLSSIQWRSQKKGKKMCNMGQNANYHKKSCFSTDFTRIFHIYP
jgi:hypothetical protein